MRQLRVLLVLGVLLLLISSVTAIEERDVFSLAQHYPADTPFYAAVRTDIEFVESLDDLFQIVKDGFQAFIPPSITLEGLLDDASVDAFGTPFDEAFSWLGTTASVGYVSFDGLIDDDFMNDDEAILIAVEITDQAMAAEFFRQMLDNGFSTYTEEDRDGFLVLRTDGDESVIAVGDTVAYIAGTDDIIPFNALDVSLADTEQFQNLRTELPAEVYNVSLYLDVARFQSATYSQLEFAPLLLRDLAEANGQMLMGFTVLGESTLTIDVAQQNDVVGLYESIGLEGDILVTDPVNLEFANNIPADAPIVLHGTDLGPSILYTFDIIRQLSDLVDENGGLGEIIAAFPDTNLSQEDIDNLNKVEIKGFIGWLNAGFAGMTGRNLEREVLPWMDGDFATFIRILPGIDEEIPILPDTAFLIQSEAGADGPADMLTAVIEAAEVYDTPHTIETIVGNDALVFPTVKLLSPQSEIEEPRVDILFSSNDDYFIFGTREGVSDVLLADGTLANTEAYQNASAYLLDDAQQVYYLAFQPFSDLITELVENRLIVSRDAQQARSVAQVLSTFESATVSTIYDATGFSLVRFTLTLNPQAGL